MRTRVCVCVWIQEPSLMVHWISAAGEVLCSMLQHKMPLPFCFQESQDIQTVLKSGLNLLKEQQQQL